LNAYLVDLSIAADYRSDSDIYGDRSEMFACQFSVFYDLIPSHFKWMGED
jgi:hypothetical protein